MDNHPHPLPNECGEPFYINVLGPAAGSNFSQLMPGNYIYRIYSVNYKIVTDATVTNRYPGVGISNAGGAALRIIPALAVPASRTVFTHGIAGLANTGTLTTDYYNYGILNPFWLTPLDTLNSNVIQIQAADQLSDIWLAGHRWPFQNV